MIWQMKERIKGLENIFQRHAKMKQLARQRLGLNPPVNDNPKPKKAKKFNPKPLVLFPPRFGWTRDTAGYAYPRKESETLKSPFSSAGYYGKWLEKKGFTRLGSGAFSIVYGHPKSNRVIKVTHRPDNWIDYCMWAAKKGFAGSYAPKVFSFKRHNPEDKEFTVAVVERMKQTVGYDYAIDGRVMYELFSHYVVSNNLLAGVILEDLCPGLPEFGKELDKEYEGLDVHAGNFMVREDGSFCVTDPVTYGGKSSNYKRLKAKDFVSLANAIDFIYILGYKGWYEDSIRHRM